MTTTTGNVGEEARGNVGRTVRRQRAWTFRDALREGLQEEMRADPRVVLLGEDIGRYGGAYAVTRGLLEEFGPERVIDTPMSEAMIVGAALGMAAVGGRPVAEIMYVDFMTLAMDMFVNQAAKLHCMFGDQLSAPMVVRAQQGFGRGAGAQHSQCLEAWFTHVPGLRVVVPASATDVKGLLKASIRDPNPVIFLEHKQLYGLPGERGAGEDLIPLGSAAVRRPGSDLTIVTWSAMVPVALEASETLAADGIDTEVVDLRCLSPVDWDMVERSARQTGRVLVVHEAVLTGGFGGEILAHLAEHLSPVPAMRRLATPDVVLPANLVLERQLVPDAARVVESARHLVEG